MTMTNKIFSLLLMLSFFQSYGQAVYTFLTEMSEPSAVPNFTKINGLLIYNGSNPTEANFYAQYQIITFEQSFPDSSVTRTKNVYTIISYNNSLMNNVLAAFPSKFLGAEDISNIDIQLLNTYPNDFGTTIPSTLVNYGIPLSLSNFDYIGVPKAWDYGYGSSAVKIGISDSGIDVTDIDFSNKTTLLPGYIAYNPPYTLTNESWHGTATTAIAAAQGNNFHGTVGICSNCSVVATHYNFGTPGTSENPTPAYNNLLQLANAGAKVINMSWGHMTPNANGYSIFQWVIDEIHSKNVVLVAGAGNITSFQSVFAPNYLVYGYPASHNHVISVSSVSHKNNFGQDEVSLTDWGEVSRYVKDMISPSIVTNYQGNGPYAFSNVTHTTNEKVDIVAPGWQIAEYPWYVLGNRDNQNNPLYYGNGTSGSAPHVSGTIGLMFSQNSCLLADEVEDILQLTSKQIETLAGNEPFVGRCGSGKLETGDAVEFTIEMKSVTGNALIEGQNFYRFDFKLENIANILTISNQVFRDDCMADFTAKKAIDILTGTDLNPTIGFTDLKINSGMINCSNRPENNSDDESNYNSQNKTAKLSKLYPNPNKGSFTIAIDKSYISEIDLVVIDVLGKVVYTKKVLGNLFDINMTNVPSGIYYVCLTSMDLNETLKFVKN